MIRVLLIEDHDLVRYAISRMLSDIKGISVIGGAKTGREGLALAREQQPDLVLLDLHLPDTNGLEIARKIFQRSPQTKILVLTAMSHDVLLMQLLDLGIQGYMTKEAGLDELERAIRAVHSGQRYMSPAIASRVAINGVMKHGASPFHQLSQREMETLLLIAKGMNADEISKQLFISAKTVNSYRYRMFEKLGVHNDVELIMLAIKHKLIDIDSL